MPLDQRDAYSNLILLCPTDHARIDDRQSGPALYPTEKLLEIKQEHEKKMSELGDIDRGKQRHEEKWGQIIDELGARLHWDSWADRFSGVFNSDGPTLHADFVNDLSAAAEWIISRVWPDGHPYLRETIKHHNWVLIDFLQEFDKHSEYHPANKKLLRTGRFYKIRNWDHQEYNRLLDEYDFHVSLVCDLGFELTRYGNLIADIVRREIDSLYRIDEGVLLVRQVGILDWYSYRVEFGEAELKTGQPYQGREKFLEDRLQREVSA